MRSPPAAWARSGRDRKSTRLNSSHTEIYTLSLHDALPIPAALYLTPGAVWYRMTLGLGEGLNALSAGRVGEIWARSEEHTSELQSHRDLHSFPTRRSSDPGGALPHARRGLVPHDPRPGRGPQCALRRPRGRDLG